MKKMAFSLERCRKNQFWHSHAAWECQKKMIAMQHGNAKTDFCDTSQMKMPM